eukprot:COSAG02_NODE_878_length_16266_cov_8.886559_5_plen_34_part_00
MCGGEIVDEKWKFSFQGALTSTVPDPKYLVNAA